MKKLLLWLIIVSMIAVFSLAGCKAEAAEEVTEEEAVPAEEEPAEEDTDELEEVAAEVHNYLGVTYYDKGMYDEAIAELKKAIEIDPNFAEAHYNLGAAYYDKGM